MRDYREVYSGARVVITGACGIFGTWLAEAFAAAGARLLLTDASPEPLRPLADRLGATAVAADLTDTSQLAALTAAIGDTWESPDVLVNNAGVYPRTPLATTGPADVRRILDVNVVAPFELTRQVIALMIKAGIAGRVVNISSGAAVRPGAGGSVYAASKAAIETLTRSIALEVARHGIRVNAVQPGFAPGSAVSPLTDTHITSMLARIPLHRLVTADEVAAAVVHLAGPQSAAVTGQTLVMDGGLTAA